MHLPRQFRFEPLEPRQLLAAQGVGSVGRETYLVMLNDRAAAPEVEAGRFAQEFGGQAGHVYQHGFHGFSLELPSQAVAALAKNPHVAYIEPDSTVQLLAQTLPPGIDRIEADLNPTAAINGVDATLNVDIAILDSGISLSHPDLRVAGGASFVDKSSSYDDSDGHGSHVAGIAAGLDNGLGIVGVAPGARLWSVRAFSGGSGTNSAIIAGMDWILGTRLDADPNNDIDVVNMSFGGLDPNQAYRWRSCGVGA